MLLRRRIEKIFQGAFAPGKNVRHLTPPGKLRLFPETFQNELTITLLFITIIMIIIVNIKKGLFKTFLPAKEV